MAQKHSNEFRREAVRIALTSGLARRQVANDLNVGFSTLAKWIQRSKADDLPPAVDVDLAKENERLRKENRLLMEERDISWLSTGRKAMHASLRGDHGAVVQ